MTAKRIHDLATEAYSCKFMDESIMHILTNSERTALFDEVKDILLSNDCEIISQLKSEWDEESDPSDMFSTIRETLEMIVEGDDEKETRRADAFLCDIHQAVEEMNERWPSSTDYKTLDTEKASEENALASRSIFDDIDE